MSWVFATLALAAWYRPRVAIDASSVRAFMMRPWRSLEEDTERHRAEMHRRDPEWTWRTAAALRASVVATRPDWPTPEDRQADLEHHLHVSALLERASRELARRRSAR